MSGWKDAVAAAAAAGASFTIYLTPSFFVRRAAALMYVVGPNAFE